MNNLAFADALVAGLAAAGLRHAVIAPGARSAPLAAALLRRPEIRCEVITDERVAGYFALGLAKVTRRPAAVVCTSGTAAANLLPAVMEADLAAVPLIVLTADRPPEAHGFGANQTTEQTRLYGSHARAFHALPVPDAAIAPAFLHALAARLVEESLSPLAGPVHANLPFREPLLPEAMPPAPALPAAIRITPPAPAVADAGALAARLSGRRGVILVGELPPMPGFAGALARLAEWLAVPVLAEPLSNLRHGPHVAQVDRSRLLTRQARFLRTASFRPDWVLRFGRFPVSRTLERWLASLAQSEHLLVAPAGTWPDPLHRADALIRADASLVAEALAAAPLAPAPPDWLDAWQRAEAATGEPDGFFEGTVARALVEALPEGGHAFVGNSLAIRALDAFGGTTAKTLTLHGNRGVSGIDGNFATAAGIAAAAGTPTAVLLGDQAALHDCGGLAALGGRHVVAVVMDNGGGRIFERLPIAAAMPGELLERGWIAPARIDFRALAAAFGLGYAEASDRPTLDAALAAAFDAKGPHLIRAFIDPADSRGAW